MTVDKALDGRPDFGYRQGMHTRQETFDISSLAMIAQGRPGVTEGGSCSYRNGCAAAHLVDASHWRRMHGTALHPDVSPLLKNAGHDPSFVISLQEDHDNAVFAVRDDTADGWGFTAEEWRKAWLPRARRRAEREGLDFSKVEAAARAAGWEV